MRAAEQMADFEHGEGLEPGVDFLGVLGRQDDPPAGQAMLEAIRPRLDFSIHRCWSC